MRLKIVKAKRVVKRETYAQVVHRAMSVAGYNKKAIKKTIALMEPLQQFTLTKADRMAVAKALNAGRVVIRTKTGAIRSYTPVAFRGLSTRALMTKPWMNKKA